MHVDIHSSGHAPKEELKKVLQLIKPNYFVPVHGFYFMRAANRENAVDVGIPQKNVFLLDNGEVAELTKNSFTMTDKTVDAFMVLVDGLGVGDVGEVVLRDRRILAEEGMIVIIASVDKEKGHLLKNPDIISRGFIYLKENQEILDQIRGKIKNIFNQITQQQQVDSEYLKSLIRDQVGQFLYQKTKRRPMILPVVIEV
jgi:ribonuclease J